MTTVRPRYDSGSAETLPIPADARRQARLGRFLLAERPFDAPVVREVHASPGRVREIRLLRAGRVALEEFPAEVEALPDSRRGVLAGRLRLGGRGQRRRTDCLPQQTAPAQMGDSCSWFMVFALGPVADLSSLLSIACAGAVVL